MDTQELNATKEEQAPEAVHQFVKENLIPGSEGRKCIDGRYDDSQGLGMIARPGGDFGYVMTLLALQNKHNYDTFPIKNAFDMVHKVVTANGGKFYMHSDEHAGEGHIGCGHAAHAASENTDLLYGVHNVQARQALSRAREITQSGGNTMVWENLRGDHKEEGLLIIEDSTKTVRSQGLNGGMYFVYDQMRDEEYIKSQLIPPLVQQMGLNDTARKQFEDEFLNVAKLQMNATLHLLAKDKPQYEVSGLTEGVVNIKPVMVKSSLLLDLENPRQTLENLAVSAAD